MHDVSASGQTLYLEPTAVLDSNNRLQMLQREIQREEDRVLARLTKGVRSARRALADNQQILTRLDLRQAVARLTRDLDGSLPQLASEPMLALAKVRHPLLVLAGLAVSIMVYCKTREIGGLSYIIAITGGCLTMLILQLVWREEDD